MLKHAATGLVLIPILGIGLMTLFTDFEVENIRDELTMKLMEILPVRDCPKMQAPAAATTAPQHDDNSSSSSFSAPSPASDDAVVDTLGRNSAYDPVGPYNARKAMESRALGLRDVCIKYKDFMRPENVLSSQIVEFEDILVNAMSMTTFCSLPKVAVKPMSTLFTRIRQPSPEEDNRVKYLKSNYPNSMKDMKKGILVRHPFERLISTFRHMYEKVYNPVTNEEEGGEMEWTDFIYILMNGPVEYAEFLEEHETEAGSLSVDTGMIDGLGVSRAWAPYWMQCGVCNPLFMPDFILSLDHFKEDAKTMLDILEVGEDSYVGWLNSKVEPQSNMAEVEEHYFGQLTKSEIRQIAEKFKQDLEIFGYSAEHYIALGQDDN